MSDPSNQWAGDAIRDAPPFLNINITGSENATPLTNASYDAAAFKSPGDSTLTTTDDFDIAEAAEKFLHTCSDNLVNKALTYEQCKAVFDKHTVFAEVCCAFYEMGIDFTAKNFGYRTFSSRALADPRNRLPQYPDDD